MNLTEKASYINGLVDGMDLDTTTKEGKVIAALLDLCNDLCNAVSDLTDDVEQIYDELDAIDEDLTDVEDYIFDDEDEDEDDECDCCDCCGDEDEDVYEITCPNCGTALAPNAKFCSECGHRSSVDLGFTYFCNQMKDLLCPWWAVI